MQGKPRGRPLKPLNPDASHAARLGAEMRQWRVARRLTLQELGDLVGCSPQQVSSVEHAKATASGPFVRACDAALQAEGALEDLLPAVLLERMAQRDERAAARRASSPWLGPTSTLDALDHAGARAGLDASPGADRAVAAIRQALMSHDIYASERSGPAPDLGELYRRVNSGWCAFQASQYALLADQLPATLDDAQLAARRHDGRERPAAAGLLSLLYQLATVALLKLGDVQTAWLAADRGITAAERCEQPLVLGSAGRMLTYVFLDAGECDKALQLGLNAAEALERTPRAGATRLSVLGALYLKCAVAAARRGDRSSAIKLLSKADRAARELDADRNDFWTAFGPTNVAVHTVSVAVELGEHRYVLKHARRVHLSRLPVPERRASHLLDVATAHGQSRQDTEAIQLVLAAEKLAAEEVHLRPTTRALIGDILHRAPMVDGELRQLADRLAVA